MTVATQPRSRTDQKTGAKAGPRAGQRTLPKQRLRLWLRMLRASRAIEAELRERLRVEFRVTLPQFDVMAVLSRHGQPITMTALSRELMVSNGNVTGIIDRLTQDGLAERIADDEDRRATRVRLTEAGAKKFEAMAAVHEGWVDRLLGDLDRAECETMIERLGGVARRAREGGSKR